MCWRGGEMCEAEVRCAGAEVRCVRTASASEDLAELAAAVPALSCQPPCCTRTWSSRGGRQKKDTGYQVPALPL
jgi:hypothetical protein